MPAPTATVQYGSAQFFDGTTKVVVQGLTANDVGKINQALRDIEQLKQDVQASNAGQRELAYKDLTLPDADKTGLIAGTYYMVPFNAQNQFLEFDVATGKPKDPQTVPETTDLNTAYFTIMYYNGTDLKNVGRQDVQANIQHVLYDNTPETITAAYTFDVDITMSQPQEQSLQDQKLATAKFVRDHVSATIASAGHLIGSYAAAAPGDDTLEANHIYFFDAVDQLS